MKTFNEYGYMTFVEKTIKGYERMLGVKSLPTFVMENGITCLNLTNVKVYEKFEKLRVSYNIGSKIRAFNSQNEADMYDVIGFNSKRGLIDCDGIECEVKFVTEEEEYGDESIMIARLEIVED